MIYTPCGWLASRSVGGAATQFTYTPYRAVQTVTDPDGVTTTYGYDTAHRLMKVNLIELLIELCDLLKRLSLADTAV